MGKVDLILRGTQNLISFKTDERKKSTSVFTCIGCYFVWF